MIYQTALELAQALINIESITPNDNGCQALIANQLAHYGFKIKHLPKNNTHNLWAQLGDNDKDFLVFSGHTDVVPPGELRQWKTPPFEATVLDGKLYGRGAADMKGSLAAMVIACCRYAENNSDNPCGIGLLITSDEEGEANDGTQYALEQLKNKISIKYCIVGEPTSIDHVGDNIKIGRRGSLYGKLTVIGKQGHIAYPHKIKNPIHKSFKALDNLAQLEWNDGDEHFLPTSFQIYNIHADTGATNLVPACLTADFNLRYSPNSKSSEIIEKIENILNGFDIEYTIKWQDTSQPFFSPMKSLAQITASSIEKVCGIKPGFNTSGGTSDGRFIAKTGCEIIELGPVNKSIHQVNEHVDVDELEKLTDIYLHTIRELIRDEITAQ